MLLVSRSLIRPCAKRFTVGASVQRWHSGMTSQPAAKDAKLAKGRDWQIVKSLGQYIWPKNDMNTKARVVAALSLLLAGKVLNVQVPMLFK